MLSELEMTIVQDSKEWGFGAYLQCVWFARDDYWRRELSFNKSDWIKNIERMGNWQGKFDITYGSLAENTNNPLKVELEAWTLLSPQVAAQVKSFEGFLKTYDEDPEKKEIQRPYLEQHLKQWWDIHQQWNIISNSYKEKYELSMLILHPRVIYGDTDPQTRAARRERLKDEAYTRIAERENDVRKLIQELRAPPVLQ